MGGIAGRFNFNASQPIDPHRLDAMTATLVHRGPAGGGRYVAEGIGLGHRRLGPAGAGSGDALLSGDEDAIRVAWDGQIYNAAELVSDLEARGHRFRTRAAGEVIARAYQQWGADSISRLRGMFAIALWDAPRRRLLLARDRAGIKPLHYALLPAGIVFASEIKALLQDPDVPRDWNAEAVDAYLALQYVPCPQTIYEAIFRLPPGHTLVAEPGRISIARYWDIPFTPAGGTMSEDECLEALDHLLGESMRLHVSGVDGPIGTFPPGDLNTSLVATAMERTGRRAPVPLPPVDDTPADFADVLPALAWHFDEPFADASAVRAWSAARAVREHATVALAGDGGDELWAGAARHRVEHSERAARRWLGGTGGRLASWVGTQLPLNVKGARSLRHLALAPVDACAHKHAYGLFDDDGRTALYTRDFALTVADGDPYASLRRAHDACLSSDPLERALHVDVTTYLADDVLTRVDRTSMAASIEVRLPLLDHRLVEFSAVVPASLKLKHGRRQHLLRRLLDRYTPSASALPTNQAPSAPVGEWLRGPLSRMATDLLQDGRLRDRGIFESSAVRRLLVEHRGGERDHGRRLWSLLMLELWFREFVDGASRPTRSHDWAA